MKSLNFLTKKFFNSNARKEKISILEKSIITGFIMSVFMSFAGFSHQCESISDKIIRLHIVANSNDDFDQNLKLKVRDNILRSASEYFKTTENIDETVEKLNNNLDKFVEIANNTIRENGADYSAGAEVKRMYFQPRIYDKITLPGGNYRALRVTLGSGKGKNWWCVIVPPMCLPAAEETHEIESVLNEDEAEIVENGQKYEIRFKILDIFNQIRNWFITFFNLK